MIMDDNTGTAEKTYADISARIGSDKRIQELWLMLRNSKNKEDITLKDSLEKHPAIKTALR